MSWLLRCIPAHDLLSEEHPDVDQTTAPADGDVLTYSATKSQWQPQAPAGGGHTIQDEGTSLPAEPNLNFTGGLVQAVDNPTASTTDVHVGKQPDGTDLFATSDTAPHLTIGAAGKVIALLDTLRFATASVPHIQDDGGNERVRVATTSPNITLTGDIKVTGYSRLASYGNVIGDYSSDADTMLLLRPTSGGESISSGKQGISVQPQWSPAANDITMIAIGGNALITGGSATGLSAYGLSFQGIGVGGSWNWLVGAEARVGGSFFLTSTYASLITFRARTPTNPKSGSSITEVIGMLIEDHGMADATTVTGLQIDAITAGGTRRLVEALGPTTTNLRLEATDPPNAGLSTEGDSALLLAWNENGVLSLRRLRWKSYSALSATDRVVIAA